MLGNAGLIDDSEAEVTLAAGKNAAIEWRKGVG
jgi:hypothetical protein